MRARRESGFLTTRLTALGATATRSRIESQRCGNRRCLSSVRPTACVAKRTFKMRTHGRARADGKCPQAIPPIIHLRRSASVCGENPFPTACRRASFLVVACRPSSVVGRGSGTEDLSADGRRRTQMRARRESVFLTTGLTALGARTTRSRIESQRCGNRRCLSSVRPTACVAKRTFKMRTHGRARADGKCPQAIPPIIHLRRSASLCGENPFPTVFRRGSFLVVVCRKFFIPIGC
jgi:hypothetical protein